MTNKEKLGYFMDIIERAAEEGNDPTREWARKELQYFVRALIEEGIFTWDRAHPEDKMVQIIDGVLSDEARGEDRAFNS